MEEVEDVKTFFQLLPVILFGGGFDAGSFLSWENLFTVEGLSENFKTALSYLYLSQLIMLALGIPIYHFLLYPLFYNYIPTMLNRIKVGLVLLTFSYCVFPVVGELLVCNSLTNTTCLFFHSEMFNVSSNDGYLDP